MKSLKGKYIKSDAKINRANLQNWVKWVAAIFFLSGMIMTTYAQEAIPAAGGTATGQGGSASFTVGQVVYTVLSGEGNLVIQGVQQPYEISVVTSSEDIPLSGIDVQAYPNPTTDFITLRVDSALNQDLQPLAYELLNIGGRVLEKKNISANHTNIQMKHLAPATYFLKVYHVVKATSLKQSSSVQSKTFKIIKK
ncbi:T9SS type A sorting domain-containing protein [Mariniphaga sp.]|uniref:T9SS type A sorting domain-containing protein n=1 Tax=Mariniphaga sp. TaxID=1954475 RepID=UPI003567CB28